MNNKYFFTLLVFLLSCFHLKLSGQEKEITGLIPKPVRTKIKNGYFAINGPLDIYAASRFTKQANFFSSQMKSRISKNFNSSKIKILLDNSLSDGAYKLEISPFQIIISASSEAGITSGLFSFLQLQLLQTNKNRLPCLEIYDKPRFSYRGLHLDASRNFIPIPEILKIIDMMALYKLNNFHWHLTDGPGWRIEIKKYPELTSFAAWRPYKDWKTWWASDRHYAKEGSPGAYGGYYSQDEARAVVAYASKRGISVIPEIEMPGHSEEVLATYPFLACSGKPYTQSEFCLGNEQTFSFIEDVLSEIAEIFPGKYVHMGGDEADTHAWKNCYKCQARMKSENLKTEKELQSYAMKRMEKFLHSKGKSMIGWDEIVDGGIPKETTVMSWRGEEGGIKAAELGHNVIMTPGSFCYFDQYQGDPSIGPEAIGGFLPIEKVYSYEPIPSSMSNKDKARVLGAQANVWTEYINDTEQLERMIFPRILALSEVLWSEKENKDWLSFFSRMQNHYLLLQRRNINYYRPSNNTVISSSVDTVLKVSTVKISTEKLNPEIRYSTDGQRVTKSSALYTGPFQVKGMANIHSAIIESGKPIGKESVYQTLYHKGIEAKVHYLSPYSEKYPAMGTSTLVNGQLGGFSYHDGQWQGFEGKQLEIVIELKKISQIDSLSIHFMQLTGPGIYMPTQIEYSWSEDGKDYAKTVKVNNNEQPKGSGLITQFFTGIINSKLKYLKIKAINGMKGFLFADEVILY